MTAPNSLTKYYNDLTSATLERTLSKVTDNFFDSNPILKVMKAKGKFVDHSGGTMITMPIEYAENETAEWIGRGSNVSITDNQKLTTLKYDWKFLSGSVVRYMVDEQMNKSEPQIFNLVEKNIKNLEKTLQKKINAALLQDGSTDSNKLEGFKKYIEATPAVGTVGGINSANYPFWRNQHTSMTGDDHTVVLIDNMRTMYDDCSGDNGEQDTPQMLVTTKIVKNWYEDEALDSHYYTQSNDMADLGIKGCAFKGAPILWTGGCDAGLMYFINFDYFELAYDPSMWFKQTPWKTAQDNLENAMQSVSQMNLICSNRKNQGLLSGIDT